MLRGRGEGGRTEEREDDEEKGKDGRKERREGEGVRQKKRKRGGIVDVALAVGRGVSYLARAALPKHPWVAVLGATTTPRAA